MNAGSMACSTFASVWSLRVLFGSIPGLATGGYTPKFLTALLVMALVQYFVNSALIAIHASFKNNAPVIETWTRYYLWASITYLAGAFAAGIAAQTVFAYGFYAFNAIIFSAPIILIIYLTYRTYLKNVEASAAAAQAAEAQRHFEERERILEQYAQVEKLSALGELASGVAHNFNNTLAGILGRAQMLQQSTDLEEVRRGLDIIVRVTEDGAQTVRRIQDFARQRRDHDFVPLAVDQVLLDISEITRPRWKNSAEANDVHISLELEIASQATVMGDASELREVLVNLVFNAVDAMPAGGKLRLATKEVDDFVHISISDTGSGMSEETRTRVFDPFFTTKGKAGLGLGLAVSYGIIRRHEGLFEVNSELGRGTTFTIKLPIARDVTPNIAPPVSTLSVSSSGGFERAKILVLTTKNMCANCCATFWKRKVAVFLPPETDLRHCACSRERASPEFSPMSDCPA
jgi:signal transduction histidine kinase